MTVNVAGNAPASLTNTAMVAGGGETNTANDTASDPTTINTVASQLAFTTMTQTLTAGVTSGTITVQLDDASGNAVAAGSGGQTVNLATNSAGGLFRNTTDTATITSVTILAGSSAASLKYKDTLVGTPTLTASATGLASATQQETVIAVPASQLVFTTTTQTLTAGITSGTITVQLGDASGNPVAAGSGGQVVNLGTNSAGGVFRNTADTAAITSVMISAGSSATSFKYKDTLVGTPTLTASATGLASATQQETVVAAVEGAAFVSETILDHSVEDYGSSFVQTFTLRNSGTTPWVGYSLVHVAASDSLGSPDSIPIPTTAQGTTVVVNVPLEAIKTQVGSPGAAQLAYWEISDGAKQVPISGTPFAYNSYAQNKLWTAITINPAIGPNLKSGATRQHPPYRLQRERRGIRGLRLD